MTTAFVRSHVKDYKQWKHSYSGNALLRKEMGVSAARVYHDAEDPNTVTVSLQFKDLKAARTFADAKEVKSAMERSGVKGKPEIWFAEDVEHTPY